MNIHKYFNEVFVLHCADYKERTSSFDELKKYGIEYTPVYTCITPLNTILCKSFSSCTELFTEHYKRVFGGIIYSKFAKIFDCAYNFYKIIKSSYVRGLDKILLFEDDIKFNVSEAELENYFINMPDDFHCIKFSYIIAGQYSNCSEMQAIVANNTQQYILVPHQYHINTNQMFALSREGMKYYIDFMETFFSCADIPFRDICGSTHIKLYLTDKQLVDCFGNFDRTLE